MDTLCEPENREGLLGYGSRRERRQSMRAAARGDRSAFLGLTRAYLPLAAEYLALSGYADSAEREAALVRLFAELWTRVSYAQRLSDFERMLAEALIQTPAQELDECGLAAQVSSLDSRNRFLLVAHELEDWPLRWLGLATGLKVEDLRARMVRLRCYFAGLEPASLDDRGHHALHCIASTIGQPLTLKQQAHLCETVRQSEAVKEFRANWLEVRCDLIERRQDLRGELEQRQADILHGIANAITYAEPRRPRIVEQVANRLAFSRYPELNPE
ncbi:MAG: hypothetical protein ACOCVG_01555 [Verrucomicrobiota bacterium]